MRANGLPKPSLYLRGVPDLAKFDSPWRAIGFAGLVGVDFAICIVAGVLIGRYVDRLLSTNPWCMLIGLLLGLATGVYSVYRLIRPYL